MNALQIMKMKALQIKAFQASTEVVHKIRSESPLHLIEEHIANSNGQIK